MPQQNDEFDASDWFLIAFPEWINSHATRCATCLYLRGNERTGWLRCSKHDFSVEVEDSCSDHVPSEQARDPQWIALADRLNKMA